MDVSQRLLCSNEVSYETSMHNYEIFIIVGSLRFTILRIIKKQTRLWEKKIAKTVAVGIILKTILHFNDLTI